MVSSKKQISNDSFALYYTPNHDLLDLMDFLLKKMSVFYFPSMISLFVNRSWKLKICFVIDIESYPEIEFFFLALPWTWCKFRM